MPMPMPDDALSDAAPSWWAALRERWLSGELFWQALLWGCTVKFAAAWVWIGGGTETAVGVLVGSEGVPFMYEFQTVLWLSLAVGLLFHLHQTGVSGVGRALSPMVIMILSGLLASAAGIWPFTSLHALTLWLVSLLAGALLGDRLPSESGLNGLLWYALGILVLSLLLVAFGPNEGVVSADVDEQGWRGAFYHKNGLGWISSILLTVALAVVSLKRWALPSVVALLAAVCVVGSSSSTSLVVSVGVVPYVLLYRLVLVKVSKGLAIFVQMAYLLFLGFVGQVLMPIFLEMLGKDPTFTGRTEIWALYFKSMLDTPWLGQGPGAFTGVSKITDSLLWQLTHLGHIYTPHNMYLGALGDSGFLGLFSLCAVLIYLSFVAPLKYPGAWGAASAAVGFLVMTAGFAETHEIYSPGLGWFLLLFLRAGALRELRQREAATAPMGDEQS